MFQRYVSYSNDEGIAYSYVRPTGPHSNKQIIVRFKKTYNPFYLQKEIERRKVSASLIRNLEDGWNILIDRSNPESTLNTVNKALQEVGVVAYRKVDKADIDELNASFILFFKEEVNIEEMQIELQSLGFFESSEPDFIMEFSAIPNDQYYSQLWGMEKIQAPNAWDSSTGSSSIIVAVIDSGVDPAHPDMQANLLPGYNFLGGAVRDENGHGTHVAGTVGAVGNNSIGVTGVNWNIKIMPLQVGIKSGQISSAAVYEAISYAVANGARVINMSLSNASGYVPCTSNTEYARRIDYATSQGVVVIAAAGNNNSDAAGVSPASCLNSIAVGASTPTDNRASFSNYGTTVDIAAPGVQIYSTWPTYATAPPQHPCYNKTDYCAIQGTSMASPHVAGAAALLLSANPSLTPNQVRECLVQNGDPITTDRPVGGVRLNIFKALQACSNATLPESPNIPIPTTTLPPGVTLTATPTVLPGTTATLPPGTTPTPTIPTGTSTPSPTKSVFIPKGTPTPTPDQYFTCKPDPKCLSEGKSIQLCPLICTPI